MKKIILLSLMLLSYHAYSSQNNTNDENLGAFIRDYNIWSNPNIHVCWEDLNESTVEYRDRIRRALNVSWETYSDIRFIGWGQCTSNSPGIRIAVADERPHVKALGNALDGHYRGMVLSTNYNVVGFEGCRLRKSYCDITIAVHEFGHALAFAHEQVRTDTPNWCSSQFTQPDVAGNVLFGPWDLESVMNYCNPSWQGEGTLSQGDIDAVQYYYGYTIPVVRIRSHNMSAHVLIHYHSNAKMEQEGNEVYVDDKKWKIVKGLADENAVSFESVNYPGHYLRHFDGNVRMDQNEHTSTFYGDATWYIRPSIEVAKYMFESYNFPGEMMRHSNFNVVRQPLFSTLDYQDASFSLDYY